MKLPQNTAQQPNFLMVFGFIVLPEEYQVERDVVVTLVGVMSLISVICNGILLLVIIKDPFKQLRTITAILLAFNSAANLTISLVLLVDSVFLWSHRNLSPELFVYLYSSGVNLYFIGNLLHTLNIYGTIVVPVRHSCLASKMRKIFARFLGPIFIIITCIIIIPLYTLPKENLSSYIKGLMTFICAQVVLLTVIFMYVYARIFQTLHARKQRLATSFHITCSSRQGLKTIKRNHEVAKTLFIHVLFFVIAAVPGTMVVMIDLYCTSCGDPLKLKLAALFTVPFVYAVFVFHPLLWLFRLNNYNQAMKHTLSFNRRLQSTPVNNNGFSINKLNSELKNRQRSDTASTTV